MLAFPRTSASPMTVPVMEAVAIDGRAFVVVGGADDGLSLFTITPDGRLIHLDEDVSDALQSDLLRAAGFTVDGRSTTSYGTCAACGRKRDGHA